MELYQDPVVSPLQLDEFLHFNWMNFSCFLLNMKLYWKRLNLEDDKKFKLCSLETIGGDFIKLKKKNLLFILKEQRSSFYSSK